MWCECVQAWCERGGVSVVVRGERFCVKAPLDSVCRRMSVHGQFHVERKEIDRYYGWNQRVRYMDGDRRSK